MKDIEKKIGKRGLKPSQMSLLGNPPNQVFW